MEVGGNSEMDKNFFAFPAALSIKMNSQEDWTMDWGCKEPSHNGVIDYLANDEDEDSRFSNCMSTVTGDRMMDMENCGSDGPNQS